MSGNKGYTFASENEEDMNDWINAFQAALKKNQDQDGQQTDEVMDKGLFLFIKYLMLLYVNI